MNSMEIRIRTKCQEIADLLVAKNASYGDSALNPIRIFSQADARAGLAVRIDDKLSRIRNQPDAFGEDPVKDLVGYLVLWLIQEEQTVSISATNAKTGEPT